MVRGISIILGIGLLVLWIAGITSPDAARWLAWLDLLAGLCAFIVAGAVGSAGARERRSGGPIGLAVALFVFWIFGLVTSPVVWLPWWNFGFACAFLFLGVFGGSAPPSVRRRPGSGPGPGPGPDEIDRMEERERLRRGA